MKKMEKEGSFESDRLRPINQADLLNCFYKPGTYWIMHDLINLTTDSIIVDSYDQGMGQGNGGYEGITMDYYSFTTISFPSQDTVRYAIIGGRILKNFDGNLGGTPIYETHYNENGYSADATPLKSLNVYDQDYSNVIEYQVPDDPNINGVDSKSYMNSEYGFIKQTYRLWWTDISEKILIRKNIVR